MQPKHQRGEGVDSKFCSDENFLNTGDSALDLFQSTIRTRSNSAQQRYELPVLSLSLAFPTLGAAALLRGYSEGSSAQSMHMQ